jgi:hypothetical protein
MKKVSTFAPGESGGLERKNLINLSATSAIVKRNGAGSLSPESNITSLHISLRAWVDSGHAVA